MKYVLIFMAVTAFQGRDDLPAHTVVQEFESESLCITAKDNMKNNIAFSSAAYLGGQKGTSYYATCEQIAPE